MADDLSVEIHGVSVHPLPGHVNRNHRSAADARDASGLIHVWLQFSQGIVV
jgi:hypothetical protein